MIRRLPLALVLFAAGWAARPIEARAAVWEREEWKEPLIGDAAAPGDRRLWNGRVVLRGPGVSVERRAEIADGLETRLRELFESDGWPAPFTAREPLRIELMSIAGASFSRYSAPGLPGALSIAVNLSGRTSKETVREIVRDAAWIALSAEFPRADRDLAAAAARALSTGGQLLESDREEVRIAGGAPEGSLKGPGGEIFAAAWIAEMSNLAGKGFLRRAWAARVGNADASFSALSAFYSESTGRSPAEALRVALERLYAGSEILAGTAALSDADLLFGAMNASTPAPFSWRFYSISGSLPEGRTFSWPEDAAEGFAVLRYEEAMPSDIVVFRPGESKTLPLAGVLRIDWVIPGGERPASSLASPVAVARVPDFPAAGLSAHAHSSSVEGVTLDWQTSSHRDLSGWAVFRSELDEAGLVVRRSPEWVPAERDDKDGAGYVYADHAAVPGRFYRYDVWAVTDDGALSRAFRATVEAR